MASYLASIADQVRTGFVKRFAARLWTVDFARPMMAAATVPAPDTLRIDLDFLTRADLAGVIWESQDRWSHPLLKYATRRDYRGVALAFDWASGPGLMPLDQNNGAVLTIEGRDAGGSARTWYVRLWNYATGAPDGARISLDFDDMRSGFGGDGEAVYAGNIDRMFLSLVPAAYDGSGAALASPVSTWVELRGISASGRGSTIPIGDAFLPEHSLRMCSGYDDGYNQPPDRLVEQWLALGYRSIVNHYVGMSHHYALGHVGGGRYEVAGGICASAAAWHAAFAQALRDQGFELILSVSFELLDENAPPAWVQTESSGQRGLTGWTPPSALLSPCNAGAMAWLGEIARAFSEIVVSRGLALRFQVGEPWWWVSDGIRPCFYDAATVAQWTQEKGSSPPVIVDIRGERTVAEREWLDWLGARLADATFALRDAARAAAGEAEFQSHLLFFAPQVLNPQAPELKRANMPVAWARPAWDVLQLEDYDFVVSGNEQGMRDGRAEVSERLLYPLNEQHYLAGFVLDAADAELSWPRIAAAIDDGMARGTAETLVWAWPQVARDGFTYFCINTSEEDADVLGFHDVRFPLELGFDAVGGPQFSTQVAVLASGYEQRNVQWATARLSYDAGIGVRSEDDLLSLLSFFRARRGQAFAFRFRDPIDWTSANPDGSISATDQILGYGDGQAISFQLVKTYGEGDAAERRPITRPVAGTVRVAVDGVELVDGWTLGDKGVIRFATAPGAGREIRAGFHFDVPVRFSVDRLELSLSRWKAGEIPSVPIVEVRE